jgi:starch-binding outer membrane protein, SusD/RagB family
MKTHKLYILALTLLSLGSCQKDFLDSEPITKGTEQNFYRTKADAARALVGCYDGLQTVWAAGIALPVAAEIMSDNAFGGTGNSDGFGYQMIDEFDKQRSPADVTVFGSNWSGYYKAVYRCNVLLSKISQINWEGDEAARKAAESEARFLRAYLYFDMVRLWGNIPLLTTPSAENVPQSNADEVYKQIAEDLKFAADNLPETAYSSEWAKTNGGRITKWAAEALIGRVFLYYTGYYGKTDLAGVISKAQAVAYLENVITKSGHGLLTDYTTLWPAASVEKYAGEDNKETVFAIKYTYTSNYNGNTDGNHWMVMTGMREQSSYPYGNGWGGATVNAKLWNSFSNTDTRRNASIISIADEGINFSNKPKQREYTGYYNKKYSPMINKNGTSMVELYTTSGNFMISQYQDYVSIRYSDVLLMAAELGSANAQEYFNMVRQRAYGNNYSEIAATKENILKERRLEFVGEGLRFWDLLRQGVNAAAAAIAETVTLENGGVATPKTISATKIIETKGLQQIPTDQINLSNNVLKQNQGW